MAGIYGAGIYGNGDYSASTQISLDAVMTLAVTMSAIMGRERPLDATLVFTPTLSADIDMIFALGTTLAFELDFDALLNVAHQYLLEATLVIDAKVSLATVTADYAVFATLDIVPVITSNPYLGPFWADDGAGGNWTPEPGQTDIWVPENTPPNPWG